MLHALGIYIQNGNVLEKIKYAQREKPSSNMFFQTEQKSINQLENIDEVLSNASFYSTMEPNRIYRFKANNECNYLYKINSTIFAISSKTELEPSEKAFLFKNMEHILIRPDKVKITLDDMIANPFGFTGRDLLIGRVQDEMKAVIATMQDNLDKVIKRAEDLEELQKKTEHLSISAVNFEKEAKKLNSCCW